MATLRRHLREIAIQAIYMCDSVGVWNREFIVTGLQNFIETPEVIEPAADLTIEAHRLLSEIDNKITKASRRWSVARMARLDRSILRLAVYEMITGGEISIGVTLNESIELGRKYGSEESPQFINGILDRVAFNEGLKTVVPTSNPTGELELATIELPDALVALKA